MKVRYSPQATRDLASIHEYLAERSPKGAANVMAAIYASVEFIKQYPRGAERTNIVGIFGKVVSKYHFKVYYRIADSGGVVEIVHIRHTSRRPWKGPTDN